jgi:hypothetical protein
MFKQDRCTVPKTTDMLKIACLENNQQTVYVSQKHRYIVHAHVQILLELTGNCIVKKIETVNHNILANFLLQTRQEICCR